MTNKLVRVVLPYATYGIIVEDGTVIDAPPIARWMVGKTTRCVRKWLDEKGAIYKIVEEL